MNPRDNIIRTVRFEKPEYIPMVFSINAACWEHYPQGSLEELMAGHPRLFPDYKPLPPDYRPDFNPWTRAGQPFKDDWGCVWETSEDGITGTVNHHPLADWEAFDDYQPPDPERSMGLGPVDWESVRTSLEERKKAGHLATANLRHGHTFLQLIDIRGYENLLYDMMAEESRLMELIGMVEEFNLELVRRYIEAGAEYMAYPEDLGMQVGPMLSPQHFRQYIKPSYERLIAPAREAGAIIHMHSDGDIRTLVDDLIDGGVEVLNLQDLVNGIDWIAEKLAGEICIDLDIDRQKVTPFGSPADIDNLIREEVEKIGRPEGGLSMIYGLYPGVPLKNVKALMDAMERYMGYYS